MSKAKDYNDERRQEALEHTKARIRQILRDYPGGLTVAELTPIFYHRFHYSPLIDNKLRAMRKDDLVTSEPNVNGVLVWKLKLE